MFFLPPVEVCVTSALTLDGALVTPRSLPSQRMIARLPTHHGKPPPLNASSQRNHCSPKITSPFSTVSVINVISSANPHFRSDPNSRRNVVSQQSRPFPQVPSQKEAVSQAANSLFDLTGYEAGDAAGRSQYGQAMRNRDALIRPRLPRNVPHARDQSGTEKFR